MEMVPKRCNQSKQRQFEDNIARKVQKKIIGIENEIMYFAWYCWQYSR